MFSKEWKLAVLSLFALAALTACPGHKKKNVEATNNFKGLWVNAEAYERLGGMGMAQDNRLCFAINQHPRKLGIVRTFTGELMLDAWVIHGNGEVFRYSAYENSAAHGYRSPRFLAGRVNGINFNRDTRMGSGTYTAYQYGSPFSRGTGILTLEGNQLFVSGNTNYGHGGGSSTISYVRVSNEQLTAMTSLIASCGEVLDYGDGWRRPVTDPRFAPGGPQVLPQQVGPQVPPPGMSDHLPPK